MSARVLLLPVMAYAAVGLALSLIVHALSFADIVIGGHSLFFALHIGIFPLWLIIVPLSMRRTGWSWQGSRGSWKALLVGCPRWMKYMTYGFFAYAIVNFVMIFAATGEGPRTVTSQNAELVPLAAFRGFSGHWMAFYSAGLAVATSFYLRGTSPPKCSNGHVVGLNDRFCSTCGANLAPVPEGQIQG